MSVASSSIILKLILLFRVFLVIIYTRGRQTDVQYTYYFLKQRNKYIYEYLLFKVTNQQNPKACEIKQSREAFDWNGNRPTCTKLVYHIAQILVDIIKINLTLCEIPKNDTHHSDTQLLHFLEYLPRDLWRRQKYAYFSILCKLFRCWECCIWTQPSLYLFLCQWATSEKLLEDMYECTESDTRGIIQIQYQSNWTNEQRIENPQSTPGLVKLCRPR